MSEWDSEAIRDYWKQAEENWYRYFVTVADQPEQEVSVEQWRNYERLAGFIPGFRGCNATGGFMGYDAEKRKIAGRMMWNGPAEELHGGLP